MIKWPITYTDYNGAERTEEFYFNLNRAEVIDMNIRANGAYVEKLQRAVDQQDGTALASEFKMLILKAYGEKSPDGRRFVKSEQLSESFEQTEAYTELYLQLLTDPEACTKFVKGVLPAVDNKAALSEVK